MDGRGLRSILQPVFYVGVAAILHGLLLLVPAGGPGKRDAATTRGLRVKAFVERHGAVLPTPRVSVPEAPSPPREREKAPPPPEAVRAKYYSALGTRTASGESADIGVKDSGARPQEAGAPSEKPLGQKEYEAYLKALQSAGAQERARQGAQRSRAGLGGAGVGSGGAESLGRGGKGTRTDVASLEGGGGAGGPPERARGATGPSIWTRGCAWS